MIYRAQRACVDVGGRYFNKGESAELDPKLPHSRYLIPERRSTEEIIAKVSGGKPLKPVSPAAQTQAVQTTTKVNAADIAQAPEVTTQAV